MSNVQACSFASDRKTRHGRDNKLCVWQLNETDETDLSRTLPIDDASIERKDPWLLHSLHVNAMNFCAFAMVLAEAGGHNDLPSEGILVATPGLQDGHVNVTSLPDEERIATIPNPKDTNTGMVMGIQLLIRSSETNRSTKELLVFAGYESGHVCVWQQKGSTRHWLLAYMQKPHAQPVLSLSIGKAQSCVFSSAADAIVARHPFGKSSLPARTIQTKHAGQQGLTVRSDEKIFATAGWDGRMRVYSVKTLKELAVLKWHNEGCYAVAFAEVDGQGSARKSERGGEEPEAVANRDLTFAERRAETARTTHWLAAGSKDGKVSLWDVY